MIQLTQDQWMSALCLWREARGCTKEAMLAVYWVIMNRAHDATSRWPKNVTDVILQPMQFSSFNRDDPNSSKFPRHGDNSFAMVCEVVAAAGVSDPTLGANHYHSPLPGDVLPGWADPSKLTTSIAPFRFYKL